MNITGRSCSKWCCRNPWCSLSSAFTPGFNQEAYESMGIFYIFFLSCIFLAVFWKKKKMHRCSLCAKLQHLLGRTSQRRECRHDIPIYIFFCFLHFYLNPDSFFPSFSAFSPHFPTMETLMLLGQKPAAFFFPSHPCKAPFSHVFGFLPARHPHPSANTCIGATFPIFFCRLGTAELFIRGCIRRGDYFL